MKYAIAGSIACLMSFLFAMIALGSGTEPITHFETLFRMGAASLLVLALCMAGLGIERHRTGEHTKALVALMGLILPTFLGIASLSSIPVAGTWWDQVVDLMSFAGILCVGGGFLIVIGPSKTPQECEN